MRTYSKFQPTGLDSRSNFIAYNQEAINEIQSWLVLPCGVNRDSDCLTEYNYHAALKRLGGEGDNVQVHEFGHWACGWYKLILVRPGSPAEAIANEIESALEDYPILDESDFSEREDTAAQEIWSSCYSVGERIEYIKRHRSQFEFSSFADMLGCIRGQYFAGYASELLG